jgi:hypothetical protein
VLFCSFHLCCARGCCQLDPAPADLHYASVGVIQSHPSRPTSTLLTNHSVLWRHNVRYRSILRLDASMYGACSGTAVVCSWMLF